ncbi:GntR family transcriptional regulator [Leucobacter insecticola]|uniref:GntR family transcriptional regulator n=1 Tax=Leucobacter insecticola TaxID=2714934 RepID=A0A6G8FKK3_9MICO|nr:GntR family transcriptional regulator [Leucobacter insecticola]QIM16878.1 GntR family transcriptional regulator [Leucobacter insecticola]
MRASDRAYSVLLDEIQRGILRPGAVLGEVEQATRLGVSRTPMREAIRRLAADGLIAQQSPRVTVVTEFDAEDIQKLFVTRRALEETAARIAAARPEREVFQELARSFETTAIEDDGAVEAYYGLIADFDAAIDAAVDNPYLTQGLRTIRTHLARARRLARDNHARLQMSVAEHSLIARAIADGDAGLAAHATHVHLHNALTSILESIREGSQ